MDTDSMTAKSSISTSCVTHRDFLMFTNELETTRREDHKEIHCKLDLILKGLHEQTKDSAVQAEKISNLESNQHDMKRRLQGVERRIWFFGGGVAAVSALATKLLSKLWQ